jgi:hypothetical protein
MAAIAAQKFHQNNGPTMSPHRFCVPLYENTHTKRLGLRGGRQGAAGGRRQAAGGLGWAHGGDQQSGGRTLAAA